MTKGVHARAGLWFNELDGSHVDGGFLQRDDAVAAGRAAADARGSRPLVDEESAEDNA
ncbi:hypothetical protein [Cellulomonas humilata]|uniref:Uncharacterized protein n=1 Tax=Cellulomonas humilata TaxID=144055 RepID=A0ABU0EDL1_9CELL|nr:hypothetical protein [Cellulomonas humilata]MDQ0373361.1 hypothetical protein [Cellulomonas humilata]